MPHRPEWMEGMERLVRHDGESRDTDRPTWSHHRRCSGGQGRPPRGETGAKTIGFETSEKDRYRKFRKREP